MENNELRCSRCGSTHLTTNSKGFSLGKAAVGGFLLGPVGLLGGTIGSNKIRITCLECGYTMKPGETNGRRKQRRRKQSEMTKGEFGCSIVFLGFFLMMIDIGNMSKLGVLIYDFKCIKYMITTQFIIYILTFLFFIVHFLISGEKIKMIYKVLIPFALFGIIPVLLNDGVGAIFHFFVSIGGMSVLGYNIYLINSGEFKIIHNYISYGIMAILALFCLTLLTMIFF